MSQYTLTVPEALQTTSHATRAQCGYDPRLRTYFLTVWQDGDVVYTSLAEPRGGLTLDGLHARLDDFGLKLPDALKADLARDVAGENPSNHTGAYAVEAAS